MFLIDNALRLVSPYYPGEGGTLKLHNYAIAAAFVTAVSASGAIAATYTYDVYDHSNGGQANAPDYMDYGLRLDTLYGKSDERSFWSFEDMDDQPNDIRNNSLARLKVDTGAGTASLSGQMRYNFDDSLWDVTVNYTGISVLSGAGATASFGATTMMGTLTNGMTTYELVGKKKPNGGIFDFTLAFESGLKEGANDIGVSYRVGPLNETSTAAGWVSSIDGGQTMTTGTNDFLYTVELAPVPLPAAGWMLLAGVGGMLTFGSRRKKS